MRISAHTFHAITRKDKRSEKAEFRLEQKSQENWHLVIGSGPGSLAANYIATMQGRYIWG
jgi:hypothetical protein